ncbi:hypothetical protein [Merismopedia glauca]|uniref:Uncharacterized protein n=1 Tax=Merismopedia glauca CCAP 1448/3 TaxID=1296344 RepID=A0A2T1C294_9CYAN|nr:hypothetical protein [Merismopedia glauca]PSB02389.1 hypothetical protein C7B64_13465 [Merismopedia glauca CCAP 1448/3]
MFAKKKQPKLQLPGKVVKNVDLRGKQTFKSFEKTVQLQTFIRYLLPDGREVGAMLLNEGRKEHPNYILRFGWSTSGFHEVFSVEQGRSIMGTIESMLAEIPLGQTLRIQNNIFSDDAPRQAELIELFHQAPDDNCRILLGEELKIHQDLHRDGICRPKEIFLYGGYQNSDAYDFDSVEQLINWGADWIEKLSRANLEVKQQALDKFLLQGYEQGFITWQNLFVQKLQTSVSPLTVEQLWHQCRLELNRFTDRTKPSTNEPIPQVITFDLRHWTITETINTRLSPATVMVKDPLAIPVVHRDHLEVDGKKVACLFLADHPKEFRNEEGDDKSVEQKALKYLWDWLSRPQSQNMKLVLEVRRPAMMDVQKTSIQTIQDLQANQKEKEGKGLVSEAQKVQLEKAIAVQRDLASDQVVVEFALCAFIYRDTVEEMRLAAREVASYFNAPASMLQDIDTPYSIWVNALPFSSKLLLVDFAGLRDRRDRTYAHFMPALCPLINTVSLHQTGLQFISTNGGAPIFFDPFKHQGHTAIYGESRSGKSLLMAHLIYNARLRNMPVTILDFPPSGQASTFKDFVIRLGGAYFDVFHHCINLLETPEIPDGLDAQLIKEFVADTRVFQQDVLTTIVLGADRKADGYNALLVKSLIGQILERFWTDDAILELHRQARWGGLGSASWENYPVLHRDKKPCLTRFCSIHHLDLANPTSEEIDTLSFIRQRLTEFALSPYGKNLSSPSSFSLDAPLIAIAMRGKVDNDLAAVFGSVMFNLAYRKSVEAAEQDGSMTVVDETAIVLENPSISSTAGATAANGLKAGMRLVLAAQTPAKVINSAGGKSFSANIFYNLIGRVQSADIGSYQEYIGLPAQKLLDANTKFPKPSKSVGFSQWLLSIDGTVAHGRIYLPPRLINLTANNIDEVRERDLSGFSLKPVNRSQESGVRSQESGVRSQEEGWGNRRTVAIEARSGVRRIE